MRGERRYRRHEGKGSGTDRGMAATAEIAPRLHLRPPNRYLLAAVAAVGCVAPLRSAAVALADEDVDLVSVALLDWVTVPYILAGLVAWLRRPESRRGRYEST